jgi:hypothetical protein
VDAARSGPSISKPVSSPDNGLQAFSKLIRTLIWREDHLGYGRALSYVMPQAGKSTHGILFDSDSMLEWTAAQRSEDLCILLSRNFSEAWRCDETSPQGPAMIGHGIDPEQSIVTERYKIQRISRQADHPN